MDIQRRSQATGEGYYTPENRKAPLGNGASRKTEHNGRGNYKPKLPPFGKQLITRLSQGDRPSNVVWIACGIRAWDRARHDLKRSDSAALCLPYGDSPAAYRWPVAGLACVVAHTGGLDAKTLRTLGMELIRAGSDLAVIMGAYDVLGAPYVSFMPRRVEG